MTYSLSLGATGMSLECRASLEQLRGHQTDQSVVSRLKGGSLPVGGQTVALSAIVCLVVVALAFLSQGASCPLLVVS